MNSPLFERLVALSGLSPIFAEATVLRAVERAGLSAERLGPVDIDVLIPTLRATLAVYLGASTEERIEEIRKLSRARPPR